jgi:hypothetical protein
VLPLHFLIRGSVLTTANTSLNGIWQHLLIAL